MNTKNYKYGIIKSLEEDRKRCIRLHSLQIAGILMVIAIIFIFFVMTILNEDSFLWAESQKTIISLGFFSPLLIVLIKMFLILNKICNDFISEMKSMRIEKVGLMGGSYHKKTMRH